MKITLSEARKLVINCQGLGNSWKLPKGKEGVVQITERLGFVQIDTIAVVNRAHHHTLWVRRPDYTPQMLHELLAQDRRVFEWWLGYVASYLPMSDYRYYEPLMRAFSGSQRDKEWLEQNSQIADNVLKRIREEGALGSADFPKPKNGRGTWWDWKPAKKALEILFRKGEVMISERRNFQRIYDLTERVLPAEVDTTEPDEDEIARFVVRRALGNHGLASIDGMGWGYHSAKRIPEIVEELRDSGEIVSLEISGRDDQRYYALTANVEAAEKRGQKQVHILSPFDNLAKDRGRLRWLFSFDFKLECYTPASKRQYGYFCLPVLWGTEFVGRLDPKADRKKKVFIIRKMIFEPDFEDYEALMPVLADKLNAFAAFNGCERIEVEQVIPESAKEVFCSGLH